MSDVPPEDMDIATALKLTREALEAQRKRILAEIDALKAEDAELALTLRVMEKYGIIPALKEAEGK